MVNKSIFKRTYWFEAIDNSHLIIFRIFYGFLCFAEGFGAILTGWVKSNFVDPTFHFHFIGFEFLGAFMGETMYYVYALYGILGLLIMVGWRYRLTMFLAALVWSVCYFAQKTSYNNHYYFIFLLNWVMVFMPAHRYRSLDVRQNRVTESLTCARWCVLFFIFQIWIVYTYASIAKWYPGWLNAEPISLWFSYKGDYPIIGGLLIQTWFQYMVAYGGVLFDGLIVPFLLWKKTRKYAFGIGVFFHLMNSAIFQIGVFPYMMLALSVFFFEPERIRSIFLKNKPSLTLSTLKHKYTRNASIVFSVLMIYFAVQIALPLRHHLYQGEVLWNEEGHRLAWRMMLRSKSGSIYFKLKDTETGAKWNVYPHEYLSPKQTRKMSTRPPQVWQFTQHLKEVYAKEGKNVEIYAESFAQLNKRPRQRYIDPSVDLAQVEWHRFKHSDWILPLKQK